MLLFVRSKVNTKTDISPLATPMQFALSPSVSLAREYIIIDLCNKGVGIRVGGKATA